MPSHQGLLPHLSGGPVSKDTLLSSSLRRPSTSSTPITCDLAFLVSLFQIHTSRWLTERLAVTQKQYDTAKEVVLDILGYGVPPEYLIDCGISKEIIYYVFTELNLRLPSNLVTTGIPPYPPTPDMMAPILFSQSGRQSPHSATTGPTVDGDTARRGSIGHSGQSPRPTAPQGVQPSPVLSSRMFLIILCRRHPDHCPAGSNNDICRQLAIRLGSCS